MKHSNEGVISVEASITLTLFIFAFLAVTSLTSFVRAESKIQYALNQTVKEFSEYSYIYNRATDEIESQEQGTQDIDELVNNLNDFNKMVSNATTGSQTNGNHVEGESIYTTINAQINKTHENVSDIYNSGEVLYNQLKSFSDNPSVVLSQIYKVFKDEAVSDVKSKILAPLVAKILMPKYIADDMEDANKYLEDLGVKGGFDGLNFSLSSIMDDKTTISFTVIYKVTYDIPLIGDYEFDMSQTATCAAWGKPGDLSNTKLSVWSKPIEKRNAAISKSEKASNATIALANDVKGLDLYDSATNTLTKVTTLGSNILNSALKVDEEEFKSFLKKELDSLQATVAKTENVKMNNGSLVEVGKSPNTILKVYFPEGMVITDTQAKIYAGQIIKDYPNFDIQIRSYEGK